jgi:hypothetical protein
VGQPVVESVLIASTTERVYAMVSDVARMGQWSPEASGARGADRVLAVGDRFVGLNRRGPVVWFTICTVTAAEPGRAFEFLVDVGPVPVSRWRYDLRPLDDGVELVETWEDRRGGPTGVPLKLMGQFVIPGSRPAHNRQTMRATLQAMKAAAEAGPADSGLR